MNRLSPAGKNGLRFDHVVGTGGIGSGIFFRMSGNHTLGRNESRMAALLSHRDFCKLHIVMHYLSVLLGAGESGAFRAFPVGKVGNDDIGKNLIRLMGQAGMNTEHVGIAEHDSTLFSVCLNYPDHSGCNVTTDNSAGSRVSPGDISSFFSSFSMSGAKELILSLPEVPLPARIRLLETGRERGSFNVASVLSSETDEFKKLGGFRLTDLLSVNIDEAACIAGADPETSVENIVGACIRTITAGNDKISVIITAGARGSYVCTDGKVHHTPVPPVNVASTAGAGDTLLAGTLAGICCGLPLVKGRNDRVFSETPLNSAIELGTLLASMAVTSDETIHFGINPASLLDFAMDNGIKTGNDFLDIFIGINQ